MAIGGYFINGYWCLLMVIILMAIGVFNGYYINGYWWIFCYWILVVINDYYITGY